jgi:polysaccharide deacetylase family protein (PEP-CTERM system associated)
MDNPIEGLAQLIISVDIEDWPQSTWDHSLEITERAAYNTNRVLDILATHNRTVTMFILGKFAERFPKIVEQIADKGHEVASHGYSHVEIFKQTPTQFREDVRHSKHLLEDLTGQPILGYRAPDFSILSSTIWALDILGDLGFQYDSSIFPIKHPRYGIEGWPTFPVQVQLSSKRSIVEIPIATLKLWGRERPVAGGGYHRLLPWPVIHRIIAHHLQQGKPFMTYCHPYEFDPEEFSEIEFNIPLKIRLHQSLGRAGFRSKFEHMLRTFESVHASQIAGCLMDSSNADQLTFSSHLHINGPFEKPIKVNEGEPNA